MFFSHKQNVIFSFSFYSFFVFVLFVRMVYVSKSQRLQINIEMICYQQHKENIGFIHKQHDNATRGRERNQLVLVSLLRLNYDIYCTRKHAKNSFEILFKPQSSILFYLSYQSFVVSSVT